MQLVQSLLFLTYLISCNLVLATPRYEDIDYENTQIRPQISIPQDCIIERLDRPPINTLCHQLMVDVVSYLDVVSIAHLSLTQKSWSHLITDPQVWRNIHWRKYLQGLKQGVWTQPFETFLKDIAIHLEDDPDKIYEMIKAKRGPFKNLAEQYNPYHEPIYFWSTKYKEDSKEEYDDIFDWVKETWPDCKTQLFDRGIGYGINNIVYIRQLEISYPNQLNAVSRMDNSNNVGELNSIESYSLDDQMIRRGSVEIALYDKAFGLYEGTAFYKQDREAFQQFMAELPVINPPALQFIQVRGLSLGQLGFTKDLAAARMLNEQLIEQGFDLAIKDKIHGLSHGGSGYTLCEKGYVDYVNALVEQDYRPAYYKKIYALRIGLYGFPRDIAAARQLNDLLVDRDDVMAARGKTLGLVFGSNCYQKDSTAALMIMNQKIHIREVLLNKIKHLPRLGSDEEKLINPNSRRIMEIEKQILLSNPYAVEFKAVGMIAGKFGYSKNPQAVCTFLDVLALNGNIHAQYLKSIGLKHGIFGYDLNVLAAKCCIKQYSLPYYLKKLPQSTVYDYDNE